MKNVALILALLMALGLCSCKGSLEVDPLQAKNTVVVE